MTLLPENCREKKPENGTALLLVDVINDLDFEGNERLIDLAEELAENILRAKKAARAANLPTIYVNDNFNKWRSNLDELLEFTTRSESEGRVLVETLKPDKEDYFVLKPMHSAFYGTPLEILLAKLGISRLILTGIAADICVLYTANDAYMRGLDIIVVSDCVESNTPEEKQNALTHMEKRLKAQIMTSKQLEQQLKLSSRTSGKVTCEPKSN